MEKQELKQLLWEAYTARIETLYIYELDKIIEEFNDWLLTKHIK